MSLFETLRLAVRAVRVNRLRSMLTTLGIVLGVAAVVAMMAVGEGAQSQVSEQIGKLGTNLLYIYPDSSVARARRPLTEDDAAAILREVPGV